MSCKVPTTTIDGARSTAELHRQNCRACQWRRVWRALTTVAIVEFLCGMLLMRPAPKGDDPLGAIVIPAIIGLVALIVALSKTSDLIIPAQRPGIPGTPR